MRSKRKKSTKNLSGFIFANNRNFAEDLGFKREFVRRDYVSLGQEIEVNITAIGSKGDGIARYKGYTIIVPNTKAGGKVNIIVKRVIGNRIFGELK